MIGSAKAALDIARELGKLASRGQVVTLDLDIEYHQLPEADQKFVDGYLSAMVDRLENTPPAATAAPVRTSRTKTLVRVGDFALVQVKEQRGLGNA
ncbi:hypothetical protein EON81_07945 [bacterium]|nr:MAG: hypothetical protein EON81_07945 [bacterium]